MSEQVTINKLLVPTWNFLKVNQVVLNIDENIKQSYFKYETKVDEKLSFLQVIDSNQNIQTEIFAKENSQIELIQVIKPSEKNIAINNVKAFAEKNATIKIIQFMLGDADTYSEATVQLDGEKSACNIDIAYLAQKQILDMNVLVTHKGVQTNSEICVEGIIGEEGKKTFRGTIDLKKGASQANGREQENVLLLSDNVQNKTVPVILCGQEDVKGSHGSAIGQINDDIVFYMNSRGIDQNSAKKLMMFTKMNRVLKKIEDEETSEKVKVFIEEKLQYEL